MVLQMSKILNNQILFIEVPTSQRSRDTLISSLHSSLNDCFILVQSNPDNFTYSFILQNPIDLMHEPRIGIKLFGSIKPPFLQQRVIHQYYVPSI